MRLLFLSVIFGAVWSAAWAGDSTYVMTMVGKKCSSALKRTVCRYVVGKDLEFSIAGVGEPDAGIHFLRSSQDGDFYASVGVEHGCVVVQPGLKHPPQTSNPELLLAFVSPKNGKVYSSWQECKRGS